MEKKACVKEWLKIDYFYMANRLGFIKANIQPTHELILDTIRVVDRETTIPITVDTNCIITLLALMWEHVDKEKYKLRDFILKIMTRIGYPTSAIIADDGYDSSTGVFSAAGSVIDQCTLTLQQSRYEVSVGEKQYLLTEFQKRLWDALESDPVVGISAPTSAGKSFVILLKTVKKMLLGPMDIVYIVPTLSLLNQVTEDYNNMLKQTGVDNFLITNNLGIGESKAEHTIYVWTQEKAIAALSSEEFDGLPHDTVLVVDEIQNVERVAEETDVRAKVLFDTLQELRHADKIKQIFIAGPRINDIANLGQTLFGSDTTEITTQSSPVLSLTYSIKNTEGKYYFKQYCGLIKEPFECEIENEGDIAEYGTSSVSEEYLEYLCKISKKLSGDQNIIFAPTTAAARNIAIAVSQNSDKLNSAKVNELISYYRETVHPEYTLCNTLQSGVAYHHGKLPVHVRRTIEAAIREKLISNIACTTTLMQGVNLPAQNVIIRNPHLYTRHHQNEAELTNYEMANLRGRAGRLLKDFVGRTIVLDESEFEETDGYDQQTLFDDVGKDVYPGYGDCFDSNRDAIVSTIKTDKCVDQSMGNYGHLVTYIRQSVLRHGSGAKQRMAEVGVSLTKEQIAAIILKLNTLTVPKNICLRNRYWDPFVLNDIYLNYNGKVPNVPIEKGAQNKLSDMLKFLRDNESTREMYERYIPTQYRAGKNRGLLCHTCIKWSSAKALREILSEDFYSGDEAAEKIENTIRLLQDTVSYNIPLLIKPLVEIKNEKSTIVSCLQAGAYQPHVRKMIEIGVPRELAIKLGSEINIDEPTDEMSAYEYELLIRNKLQAVGPRLSYWEQIQLQFLLTDAVE